MMRDGQQVTLGAGQPCDWCGQRMRAGAVVVVACYYEQDEPKPYSDEGRMHPACWKASRRDASEGWRPREMMRGRPWSQEDDKDMPAQDRRMDDADRRRDARQVFVGPMFACPMFACKPTARWRWKTAAHLLPAAVTAGAVAALHKFALAIGLERSSFQANGSVPHYDLTRGKRRAAVAAGAIELETRQAEAGHVRKMKGRDAKEQGR